MVDTGEADFHRGGVAASSVKISTETQGSLLLVRVAGRLDAHGAAEAAPILEEIDARARLLLEMSGVTYLSSAGIRLFVSLQKALNAQGGRMVVAGLQPYCREVLRVSGLDQFFSVFPEIAEALAEIGDQHEVRENAAGRFCFHSGAAAPGYIDVLGSIQHVLESGITPERVCSKKFSAKEYSIGLGALGPSVEEVLPLIGEMMTIGGTMVWLAADDHDTPDFLVPRHDSEDVVIRTAFNASLAGKFNEYLEFEAASPGGATVGEVYASLMEFARERRPDYRGAIGVAMRAEVGQVFGCGVVRAPITENAPANGRLIIDPANYEKWFEVDREPRLRDVTGLFCGIGLDLNADLSVYNQQSLNDAFYVNPGNSPASGVKLHNHGVFFQPCPLGEKPWTLEREIQGVVENGEFVDMRHVFDRTTIIWALIGVIYVQDFRPDLTGL